MSSPDANGGQRAPFLYSLEPVGQDRQDFYFRRVRGGKHPGTPDVWAMHMDITDPKVEKVLIFVHSGTPREEIMDEINQAQTYFREQAELRE
ncbi:MAG: hypothetical protein OXG38_01950 [Chloroflexi bacterium]|nr:hypothetical protein [Chloroflexota bacterium]